ncbi:IS21 family transposase [Candidatus Margulisiibacteriota bacterium]
MANRRKNMRNIKEMLRLSETGVSKSRIAVLIKSNRCTVRDYLQKLKAANIIYRDTQGLSNNELYDILFGSKPVNVSKKKWLPAFEDTHKELKTHKHLTLQLLWEEYVQKYPDGYGYSRFFHHYQEWRKGLDLSMRQVHFAGEKTFVDYAGQTVPIIDQDTGEVRAAKIFLAVLGASNYTYAEATWSEGLADWLSSTRHTFEFFGGVTEIIVPDNLKSAVDKACRYEPVINQTYQDFAIHYGVAVLPARVRKPKDKAKVETGVLIVERWILAALRHHTFFSLDELNQHIRILLEKLNTRPFKKLEGCRKTAFEAIDKPALNPLPQDAFEYSEWKEARVNIDYHIEADGHYYSIPCQYAREKVEIRITSGTVSVFKDAVQIASHVRSYRKGRKTTVNDHMPKKHKEYGEWTPERILKWASQFGDHTGMVIHKLLESKPHPALAYRSALGILRMGKRYGEQRLEAACHRAINIGACSYQSIKSILEKGLDKQYIEEVAPRPLPKQHKNIRGPQSYQTQQTAIPLTLNGGTHVH